MRYFIGIDQSLSCSGVVVLDNETKKVIESVNIKSTSNTPIYVTGVDNYTQTSDRVNYIVTRVEEVFKGYDPKDTLVCMEHLASSLKKSRDTDYVLAHLFFSLIGLINMYGFERLIVSPTSHKKLVFPPDRTKLVKKTVETLKKVKKTIDKKEVEHDLFFEDGLLKTGFSREVDSFLTTYDCKDAFCLAYFGMEARFCKFSEVFQHRTPKQKAIGDNYKLDALKGALCSSIKRDRGCWSCVVFDKCKEKGKFTESKSTLKRHLRLKDRQRDLVSEYIDNAEELRPKTITLEEVE